MTFANLHTATTFIGQRLTKFAGRHIDAQRNSYAFTQMAKAIDYINNNAAVESVTFDGEAWFDGKVFPVLLTFAGHSIAEPVDIKLKIAH